MSTLKGESPTKVLLLSQPRCMTKAVQLLISRALPEDRMRTELLNGNVIPHLDELLCFSNYYFGLDANFARVYHDRAVHFTDFHEGPLGIKQVIAERVYPDVSMLEATCSFLQGVNRPWIAKMFVAEVLDFKFDYDLTLGTIKELRDSGVKLMAFSRKDTDKMFVSRATSLVHGTHLSAQAPEWNFLEPSAKQLKSFQRKDALFHQICNDLGLEVIPAESLVSDHANIIRKYLDLDTSYLRLPDLIEYSGL